MKYCLILLLVTGGFLARAAEPNQKAVAAKIINAVTNSDFAFKRLAQLCDTFGPRFSGSTNLEASIDWILAEMKKDGLENVRGEEVMVPRWVRGKESVQLLEPRPKNLRMLGLGGSVGTQGITAEVLVVKSFDDLKNRASEAKGKIVLFNEPFTEYSKTVLIRSRGAVEAARVGAVASLIRSVASFSMDTPHTGGMRYADDVPKIPHAAITVEDAELLQRFQDRGQKIVVQIKMEAKKLPDSLSRNVVAELVGREKPDEIVVISGHLDSWDVGQGAMDDGGGCLAAWETIRLLKKLGIQPRRTIRVVLWTNEENGLAGAKAYREKHKAELAKHVLAIESDHGVFNPTGFAFSGSAAARKQIQKIGQLLKPIRAGEIRDEAGGADISQLQPDGVPIMDLLVDDTKYFWYHHTDADTMDKLDVHEFNRCVAAMAVMSFSVADAPESLPR